MDFTQEQLDRAKTVIRHLLMHDPEFQALVRRVAHSQKTEVNGPPLTKFQIVARVRTCRPLLHNGQHTAYLCEEVYDAFAEYSREDVRTMLINHQLLVKDVKKKHPVKKTDVRALVLDIK